MAKRNVQLSCFTFKIPEWSCYRWDEGKGGKKTKKKQKPDSADPVNCGMWICLSVCIRASRGEGCVCLLL